LDGRAPSAWGGCQLDGASEEGRSLAHADDSEAGANIVRGPESSSVVADRQDRHTSVTVHAQTDFDSRGAAVADPVFNRLLDHAMKLNRNPPRNQCRPVWGDPELTGQRVPPPFAQLQAFPDQLRQVFLPFADGMGTERHQQLSELGQRFASRSLEKVELL
jgi:hypothetical protein